MLKIISFPIMLLVCQSGITQEFDSLQFQKNLDRAQWIQEYDWAAGMAVEELMKKDLQALNDVLDPPFYCQKIQDSVWIFSIGHGTNKGFQPVFQYNIEPEKIQLIDTVIHSPQLDAYHQAYQHSRPILDSILQQEGPRFRTYFFTDSLIHVLSFPSPDIYAPAIFGGQFHDVCDLTGTHLLQSTRMLLPSFFNVVIPEKSGLELPYPELNVPNVETICYVLEHHDLLGTIRISTKNWVSYLGEDRVTWIHEFQPVKE